MTQFIITCAARTGSTMLRYMLDGHPEITCHGEVFTARGISRIFKDDKRPYGLSPLYNHLSQEFRNNEIIDFIPKYLLNTLIANSKASGFKFKTDEYFNTSFTEVSRYIRSNKKIKVIHLKRRDLLAQYISHEFVRKKKTSTVQFQKRNELNIAPINISVSKLMQFMDSVTQRETVIVKELNDHDLIEIAYEDVVDPKSETHKEIQTFLGVDFSIIQQKKHKILSDHYAMIVNKEEVILAINSSPYDNRVLL